MEQIQHINFVEAYTILKGLWLWMQQQYVQVLPQSAIGKALAYSLERWDKLTKNSARDLIPGAIPSKLSHKHLNRHKHHPLRIRPLS
ncbi:transposase [uncultured Chitinophaga sp.]|uniref:IS66 family transposase n=1 Tax=uncultured Chitinophaga sp. TaxID=339340 RepID=UPI0034528E65